MDIMSICSPFIENFRKPLVMQENIVCICTSIYLHVIVCAVYADWKLTCLISCVLHLSTSTNSPCVHHLGTVVFLELLKPVTEWDTIYSQT